ncbi:MAG: class I SAM-dependent methyltransferase [Syntrophobacteraceae bacterium]
MKPNEDDAYQRNFSRLIGRAMYDEPKRHHKAKKIVAVISDYAQGCQTEFTVLDVGCSTGIMTHYLADHFRMIAGVDIDEEALRYASKQGHGKAAREWFLASDAMAMPFLDDSFDAAVCAHVYEHVPDASRLMAEIHRVLKPGGICFFSAGNRLSLMEPHHRLPLLSVLPKPLANFYLRKAGKGNVYYENHLTYWGLRKLLSDFEIIDYTSAVLADPERFAATDVCPPRSRRQRIALLVSRIAYWLIPTYIFLLRKSANEAIP